jgi:hypothetical protein
MIRLQCASSTAREKEGEMSPSEGYRTGPCGDHSAGLESHASLSSEVVVAS